MSNIKRFLHNFKTKYVNLRTILKNKIGTTTSVTL